MKIPRVILPLTFLVFATSTTYSMPEFRGTQSNPVSRQQEKSPTPNNKMSAREAACWGLENPVYEQVIGVLACKEEFAGDWPGALNFYQNRLAEIEKRNAMLAERVQVENKIAWCLIKLNRLGEADKLLDKLSKNCQSHAPSSLQAAEVCFSKMEICLIRKNSKRAGDYLQQAIAALPPSLHKNPGYRSKIKTLQTRLSAIGDNTANAINSFEHLLRQLKLAHRLSPLDDLTNQAAHRQKQQTIFYDFCTAYMRILESQQPISTAQLERFYDHVMEYKGQSTEWRRMRKAIARHPDYKKSLNEVIDLAISSARKITNNPDQAGKLELDLFLKEIEFKNKLDPKGIWSGRVTLEQFRNVLKPNESFVDFVVYEDAQQPKLFAVVVKTKSSPQLIQLGDAKSIIRLVKIWSDGQGESSAAQQASIELRKLLWDPLNTCVSDSKNIIISPDGVVGFIPWAALPSTAPGKYLVEEYLFTYQLSAHDFVRNRIHRTDRSNSEPRWLILGNPDFGTVDNSPGRLFPPLPNTQMEIEQVAKCIEVNADWAEMVTLTGRDATRNALVSHLRNRTHLHLATHGFSNVKSMKNQFGSDKLVGLALAKQQSNGKSDASTITAEEIINLDLGPMDLVVLSGCSTAKGVWQPGDGAASLQRAFQIAGANSVVASLWSVPDEATSELMNQFYRNLIEKKMSKAQSLRAAQIWMIKNYRASVGKDNSAVVRGDVVKRKTVKRQDQLASPYHWGAWTLTGYQD